MESADAQADMANTATATTATAMGPTDTVTATATAPTAPERKTNNNGFSPMARIREKKEIKQYNQCFKIISYEYPMDLRQTA